MGAGRELVRLQPAPGSVRVAVRAAACLLAVLVVLQAAGHLEWSLYATFGAFTSVYGGRFPGRDRPRVQVAHAVVLTAAVATGVLVATTSWPSGSVVAVAAVWAVVAARLSDRWTWRPPGPMFPVFAVAACGSVPTTPSRAGLLIAVTAATAALAVLLGAAEGRWWPGSPPGGTTPPVPLHSLRRQRVHALRCGAAVAVAGALAGAGGIGHPYWAMVASVVPMAAHTLQTQLARGAHRAAGTVVGVGVAAVLLESHLPALALIVLIPVLQGAAELLVGRNYGLALVAITPLALLSVQLADPQPVTTLLVDRVVETLIGTAVGLLTVVVTRERS